MSYVSFVRDVLRRLSLDFSAGRLSIRVDANGRRYVVEAPGAGGRDIVLPAHDDALMVAPRPPPRDPRDLFSPYTIGADVHVPWSAIARNHDVVTHAAVDPAGVVVLRLRGDDGAVCCWFVRLRDEPRKLTQLSVDCARRFASMLVRDELLQHSSLCGELWDCRFNGDEPGGDFCATACARFQRYRKRVTAAVAVSKGLRKRKRTTVATWDACNLACLPNTTPAPAPALAPAHTCVICLDDKSCAQPRCRSSSCGTRVCDTCHADSRGLCPLCDRSAINADYLCSCCNRLHRLRAHGYPCVGCSSHSLCLECYEQFGECAACDT